MVPSPSSLPAHPSPTSISTSTSISSTSISVPVSSISTPPHPHLCPPLPPSPPPSPPQSGLLHTHLCLLHPDPTFRSTSCTPFVSPHVPPPPPAVSTFLSSLISLPPSPSLPATVSPDITFLCFARHGHRAPQLVLLALPPPTPHTAVPRQALASTDPAKPHAQGDAHHPGAPQSQDHLYMGHNTLPTLGHCP